MNTCLHTEAGVGSTVACTCWAGRTSSLWALDPSLNTRDSVFATLHTFHILILSSHHVILLAYLELLGLNDLPASTS